MKHLFFKRFLPGLLVLLAGATLTSLALPFQLVSIPDPSQASPTGGGDSLNPILSADGRYLLFSSTANNLTSNSLASPPGRQNVFLRDRLTQTTTLISVSLGGAGGNNDSTPVEISTNGQYVLFESTASDLVINDTNQASDVFLRNLLTATTTLISVSTNGTIANGASRSSALTPDARYVAFVSSGNNLAARDTNTIPDIFVRDLQTATTSLITPGAVGTNSLAPQTASSELPDITPDGRYVAFHSTAINLIPGVTTAGEIYVWDRISGSTFLASTNAHQLMQSIANTTNTISYNHTISEDGSIVVYEASPRTTAGNFFGVIFRHHLQTGVTEIINTNASRIAPTQEINTRTLDMTPDGRYLAYLTKNTLFPGNTNASVYVWDAQAGTNILASGNNTNSVVAPAAWPAITPSGQYVTFVSAYLTTNSLDDRWHLYRRDLQASVTSLVDVAPDGSGTDISPATLPRISADGRFVAFDSLDSTSILNDNNRAYDVFVRDMVAQSTELASASLPAFSSLTPNGYTEVSSPALSTNGLLAFTSSASNLIPADTNNSTDVFVRDLTAGTNLLVSQYINGLPCGTNASLDASISANGRFVAFSSMCDLTMLGNSAFHSPPQVYVHDLLSGDTTLVSSTGTGVNTATGNRSAYSPVISTDGKYVLFRSRAGNLASGPFSGFDNLFVRNLQTSTTDTLTTNGVGVVSMTPSGSHVAFASTNSPFKVYVWKAQSHANIYSNTATAMILNVALSPDGSKMAYVVSGGSLYGVDVVARTNWVIVFGPFTTARELKFNGDGRFLTYYARDALNTNQVFFYDFQSKSSTLVSRRVNTGLGGNGHSDSPDISADGRFIAYRSLATNIVPANTKGLPNLFIYDRLTGATTFLSFNENANALANNRSFRPCFSGDGQTLLFQSWGSDLVTRDFNQNSDTFALNLSSSAFTDSDGDGMNDAWELQYFNTLARDGTGDFDGDGANDLFEFQTGTFPTDPNSFFHGQLVFNGTPTLLWTVTPGKAYHVQYKDGLSDPDWKDLNGTITTVGNQASTTDPAPAANQRFYRIVLVN